MEFSVENSMYSPILPGKGMDENVPYIQATSVEYWQKKVLNTEEMEGKTSKKIAKCFLDFHWLLRYLIYMPYLEWVESE